jgi:hypothetical protein
MLYLQKNILQTYNCLKLRKITTGVKITLKTGNFQQRHNHVTFTYNLKFFTLDGSTMQTNNNARSNVECHSERRKLLFDVD